MHQIKEYRTALILAAAVAGAGLVSGCASSNPAPATVTEHQWDANEEAAYQRYMLDEHMPRRDYASLTAQQQQDYWNWRAHNRGN